MKVSTPVHRFDVAKDIWYEAISTLRDQGWSVVMGGGLDHSWAVLERDELCVETEYDIWGGGELVLTSARGAEATALFPTAVLTMLGLEQDLFSQTP